MATQTIEQTTRQETNNGINPGVETQVSLAREQLHLNADPAPATQGMADTVLPAKGAFVTRLPSFFGRLAVRIYVRLSGPAVSDRDRRYQDIQIELTEWHRYW